MDVKIYQLNGCTKCFNETILLQENKKMNVSWIDNLENISKADVAVITGYVTPEDENALEKIQKNSKKIIAFGTCATTGGIYALANQKGNSVTPVNHFLAKAINLNGCLGDVGDLELEIQNLECPTYKALCSVCKRKSTCDYLTEVNRQIDLTADESSCFNDQGVLCNGYVAKECKERCIDFNTPCRGCKPSVERSGIRMLGMFGTLMGNIEVATEASPKGATDKLADQDDDITRSVPDVTGNFFRFTLATSGLPKGLKPSTGDILSDVLTDRLIEEIPLILGMAGGDKFIQYTLDFIKAYESANSIKISDTVKRYRDELRNYQKEYQYAVKKKDSKAYKIITDKIRKIAGNMNLSNVFYLGFKSKISTKDAFEYYKTKIFDLHSGTYSQGSLEFSTTPEGIIQKIIIK